MKTRTVINSFKAMKHSDAPSEPVRFQKGEQLVVLEHDGRHTIFARTSDEHHEDPYITSDDVFLTHTQEVKP